MKIPKSAVLLLGRDREYPVEKIHFNTGLVTIKESEKVYNTVSIKNVDFNYTGLSEEEIRSFQKAISY